MAAAHDRVAVIEQLLAAGTPVDAVDAWGWSALQAAAENGRAASARVLLAAGADPLQRDVNTNETPLERVRRRAAERGETPGHADVEGVLAAASAR
jgi:ankyrin repeat protein